MSDKSNLKTIISIILTLFLFGLLFNGPICFIVSFWKTGRGAHGPLIITVSLYLIWLKRDALKTLPRQPAIFSGALLTGAGCFMLFAGKISSTILLQQVAIVPFLLGMILLLCGWPFFRILFLPIGYLIFISGIVETILSSIAMYLQSASAWIAVQFFKLISMPVVLSGTIIELPHIALEVVRACSGISHLVAIMALSVPLGFMNKLTPCRKVFLVGVSFFIGLLANGFRIFLIGVYALYNKGADLHGPRESLTVSVIFFIGMILLAILSRLLIKKDVEHSDTIVQTQIRTESIVESGIEKMDKAPAVETSPHRFYVAWAVAGTLFVITFGLCNFYKIGPIHLNNSLNTFPSVIGHIAAKEINWIDEQLRPFPADDEMIRSYLRSDGFSAEVYIGYFSQQSRERKIIDWRRDWMHQQNSKVRIGNTLDAATINKARLKKHSEDSDVYFWYVINGRIITNQYIGKLYTFLDGLFKRRTNGAVVVVQTRNSQEEVIPFLVELVPEVMDFLRSRE